MQAQQETLRAFRPSWYADVNDRNILADLTRRENIRRYARMVSEGLRLFEQGLVPSGSFDDEE
ncbi:MAG: hypothetical protein WC869_03250 [Phycisphaerae bacterium]|jgi:hypothetical protein